MDTTYVNIMLVVFLVLSALAIDVGYMYVSDEDLQHTAELSALAGAQAIKQGIHAKLQSKPGELNSVENDTVQASARVAAVETAIGDHRAVALIEVPNNDTNNMTTENYVTVGYWDSITKKYTAGGAPVNAIQVRTKRTAESESVGLGELGSVFAKITGMETMNFNPVATATISAKARASFVISEESCDPGCTFPNICKIQERKLTRGADKDSPGKGFAFTTLAYPAGPDSSLSDMVCREMPPQDVCGKTVFTTLGKGNAAIADIESMMYNPKIDTSNKEYDKTTGKLLGWWIIAPVIDSLPSKGGNIFEERTVTRYALVRISRVCASGATGCSQNGTSIDSPAALCGQENGLFFDRISCVGCGTKEMISLPGLHPVLVK